MPFTNAHALVVGIAHYEHINRLPPTVLQDAQGIVDLLVQPDYCGYLPDHVQHLSDKQATQAALRRALADLVKRSQPDSTVLIYFSSHGGQVESGPYAGEYLLPVDVDYSSAESIAQTALAGTEFTQALRAIPAGKLLVTLDCCHAGGIGQPKDAAAPIFKAGLPESYYDALKAGRGRAILASSRDTEVSWVLPGAENSLFTQHLLTGLQGGIASEDGLIRLFDLFEYVQPRVTHDQASQHPLFKAEIEENFPVALYRGGQKGVVPRDSEGYRYDAYISYVDKEPDATWVWGTLLPRLRAAGLRVAVSGDSGDPGVPHLVNIERGIQHAKRTVAVLSETYLADHMADFESIMALTKGVQEGAYRLLPVKIAPIAADKLPLRIGLLAMLDMTRPPRVEREFERLVTALQGPLPRR
jgi:hypothetical protein